MKGLILKDLLNIKGSLKTLGLMIVVFSVIFIPMGNEALSGIIILISAMMVITTMSYDAYAKWDSFALAMPISRKEIVMSKYLIMGILDLTGTIMALIIGIIGKMILGNSISTEFIISIGLIFLVALIFGSVMIPLIYRFGVEKARLLILACALLPTVFIFVLSQMNCSIPEINNGWIIGGVIIAFTLGVVMLSFSISNRIYEKKEF